MSGVHILPFFPYSSDDGFSVIDYTRAINRQKLSRAVLEQELAEPASRRHRVFASYRRLLGARASDPAFHPNGGQRVLSVDEGVFALSRTSPYSHSRVLCLHNVSNQVRTVELHPRALDLHGTGLDLLTGEEYSFGGDRVALSLPPYVVRWLKL